MVSHLSEQYLPDTATLPSKEFIDKMKENLHIVKDPKWYRFYGD